MFKQNRQIAYSMYSVQRISIAIKMYFHEWCYMRNENGSTKMKGDERNTANRMTTRKKRKKSFVIACERNCMGHYMYELFVSVIKA